MPAPAPAWRRPGRLWLGLCLLLALGALLAWLLPAPWLDWQPALAAAQPWRWWTAAFVHWSPLHLGANLAGCALLAWLGWRAAMPAALALAWLLAWPLTHLGLLLQPELLRYGGLSGVLHGGVAVVVLWLVVATRGRHRLLGAALAAGLVLKLVLEQPLGPPLRRVPGWDIALAPLAHSTGALAGALLAGLVLGGAWLARRRVAR